MNAPVLCIQTLLWSEHAACAERSWRRASAAGEDDLPSLGKALSAHLSCVYKHSEN